MVTVSYQLIKITLMHESVTSCKTGTVSFAEWKDNDEIKQEAADKYLKHGYNDENVC